MTSMRWSFAKYVGCGNDFILFDNRKKLFPIQHTSLIQRLCHRHYGIGADGVILVENSSQADFRMRIFNADGSEAEMCGNGIRCCAKFIETLRMDSDSVWGYASSHYCIETMKRILHVSIQDRQVCVEMGHPFQVKWNMTLSFRDQSYVMHYLDTGVPHVVLFMDEIERIHLQDLGSFIRHHALFGPQGTNVNLAQRTENGLIKMRTYERGVEGETLACGTGATAVALAAAHLYQLNSPLAIETRSQEILTIEFCLKEQAFSSITMTGPAHCLYQGEIDISRMIH